MNKFNLNKKSMVRVIAVIAMLLMLCVTFSGCVTQAVAEGSGAAAETYTPSNGLWEKIAIPFGWIIRVCYNLIPNYAVCLLIFAVIMKIILFPFGIKQQKNSVKQASLRPKEMAIRKKYAGRNDKVTQQKVQQEIMDLYQKENFNPMGGCLPLLLQFPILFALFSVIRNPLRYITGLSVSEIGAIGNRLINEGVGTVKKFATGDLEILKLIKDSENFELIADIAPDRLGAVSDLPNLTIFGGLDLSATPELKFNILILIPIVTFITVYLSMKLTKKLTYQPQQTDDAKTSGVIMDLAMPAMSTWFTFMYPAVLGLYWIFQNLLGVLQQLILKKMFPIPVFTEEDYKKAEQELAGKTKDKKKKPQGPQKRHPRSLHHIDDDDMEVMEIEEKPKNNKKKNDSIIESAPMKDETDGKED